MENPAEKEIIKGGVDPIDLVIGVGVKPFVEKGLSPVVGNGNLISGALKLGGAYITAKYAGNGHFGKGLAIGAGMDGAEDLIVGLGSRFGGKATPSTSAGVF